MKKLLLLLIICFSVFGIQNVKAQTLNWAKGYSGYDSDYKASWFYLSADKKYFYTSSAKGFNEYLGIYDMESGNLVKKYHIQTGVNHYLIDDSTFMYIDYFENDTVNPYQMVYDSINKDYYSKTPKFSKPLTYNGINYKIDYNNYDEYRDLINDEYLIFTGKNNDRYSIIFWDIKNRCIADVIESNEHQCPFSIESFTFDKANNMLYYSDGDNLYKFDRTSRKILKTIEINGARTLALSSDGKYLATRYYVPYEMQWKMALISLQNWKIVYQTPSCFIYHDIPIAISPNSEFVAYLTPEGRLGIYDLNTKESVIKRTMFWPEYIRFINDKQVLIGSEYYGFTSVFDLSTEKHIKSLIVNETHIRDIKYSHNGKYLAVLGFKCLKVLDAKTGNLLYLYNVDFGQDLNTDFYSLDFSKNDDKIIFACNLKVYHIFNLTEYSENFFETQSNVISVCYSITNNNVIAYGTENGELTVATDSGTELSKKQNEAGYMVRCAMFAEHDDRLYYLLYKKNDPESKLKAWDYKTDNLSNFNNIIYPIESYWSRISTYDNRYICSAYNVIDLKSSQLYKHDDSNIPKDYELYFQNISKDGQFSTFIQNDGSYSDSKSIYKICSNNPFLGSVVLDSIFPQDIIPYNRMVVQGYSNGSPSLSVISPDNKTLILGLDCGSIISLNIENLTPVEDDVKLSYGFRIVNVENKDTYLNCEISLANEFDSFDYYIYDLNGKLLNQGALGTVGQGLNTIAINYTKKMLYPALLLVKSRVNNTYQSKLFY